MRKLLIIAIFLSLAILGQGLAESQRPTPSSGIVAQQKQNLATENKQESTYQKKYNADNSKAPHYAPTEKSKGEEANKADKDQNPSAIDNGLNFCGIKLTDWLLTFFNLLLAIFTCGLYLSTEKLWQASNEQVKITRDSLALARDEFVSANRPRLIVRSVTIKPFGFPVHGIPTEIEGCVVNVGNTPTEIIESNITAIAGDPIFAARTPWGPDEDNINGTKLVPGGASTFCLKREPEILQNFSTLLSIKRGEKVLYCFGFFMYRDDIGNVRRTAFCRRFDPETERFIATNDPDYEYVD